MGFEMQCCSQAAHNDRYGEECIDLSQWRAVETALEWAAVEMNSVAVIELALATLQTLVSRSIVAVPEPAMGG